MPDCGNSVLPVYLFAFLISPSVIGNPDFIDSPSAPGDSRYDFGLDAETLGNKIVLEAVDDFFSENFITGLHIGKIQSGKQVGKQCQEFIGRIMDDVKNPMRLATDETGTENYIGTAVDNRGQQFRIFGRIIFQIRILDYDYVSCCLLKTGPDRPSFAGILIMEKISDVRYILENLPGAVFGSVVHHDYLLLQFSEIDGFDLTDYLLDRIFFIVRRNDYGKLVHS